MIGKLSYLYGEQEGARQAEKLTALLEKWSLKLESSKSFSPSAGLPVDQSDTVVITYGDSIVGEGNPLAALDLFAKRHLKGVVSGFHILPFFPYSSDDGFSIIDYRQVDKALGTWEDIGALAQRFFLMFDLVLNHCSVQNAWFQDFLKGEAPFSDYFVTVDPAEDLSGVFRPRPHPLLHKFQTSSGEKYLWTTFSEDQVDLNFANPKVLREFVDVLLFYVSQGARIIRLDAVGFLWKEIGTSCIHHPKTHMVIQLLREILEKIAPWVLLITETNVPHKENISYFGDGCNEAHMVYQFALPPLTLDAFLRGDTRHLQRWAERLPSPDGRVSFFNFLASHDGIGVLAAREFLSSEEFENLLQQVTKRGGFISYKSTPKGEIPYELNISFLSAISEKELPLDLRSKKFLASQAILLSLAGIPGIYIHSLLGSENWQEGVRTSGIKRRINRERLPLSYLEEQLAQPDSLRARVLEGYGRLLLVRRETSAFHPSGAQEILKTPKEIFGLIREAPGGKSRLIVLINVTGEPAFYTLPPEKASGLKCDLLGNRSTLGKLSSEGWKFTLDPYEVVWVEVDFSIEEKRR